MGFWFFNNYLNDLLAVPLFFAIINIVYQFNSGKQIRSLKWLFIITIILSFMGEYLAIYFKHNSVTDFWDVICYFIGMLVYYMIIKVIYRSNNIK